MKKIVLSVILATLAVAAQAGNEQSGNDKASSDKCCGKTPTTTEAKTQCTMAKDSKAACCSDMAKNAAKGTSAKPALQSPKALADARK